MRRGPGAHKSRAGKIRKMLRPNRYAEFGFMVQLIPALAQDFQIKHYDGGLDTIRRTFAKYKIVRTPSFHGHHYRIYLSDRRDIFTCQLLFPDQIWKIFELVDSK